MAADATARRDVRLEMASDNDAYNAEMPSPPSRIRPNVSSQPSKPSGPAPRMVLPIRTSSTGPMVTIDRMIMTPNVLASRYVFRFRGDAR
ncbi:unannotated protein [freshwater metagenome]|uniref:Unannotated protein n=1 Tax=freshwater metagenome TaxID=449393 RepID=A0A6J7Q8W7_9ZZZZ